MEQKSQNYQRPPRTTDKYQRLKTKNADQPEKNEIRITGNPRIAKYIAYAATLLVQDKLPKVVIKATGAAIKNACLVAEILRHRIKNLHQLLEIKQVSVFDEYAPLEEGLGNVTVEKKLALLEIILTLNPVDAQIDTTKPGYQLPLPEDQVESEPLDKIVENTTAGRIRATNGGEDRPRGRGGFRGGDRGGVRGGFGRGRGGFRGGRGRGGFRGNDRGFRGDDRGFRGDDRGFRGDDRGFRGDDRGFRGDDRGFRGDDRGPRGDDRGPREYKGGEDRGFRGENRGFREDRGFGGGEDRPFRSGASAKDKCYNCGQEGHWASQCPEESKGGRPPVRGGRGGRGSGFSGISGPGSGRGSRGGFRGGRGRGQYKPQDETI